LFQLQIIEIYPHIAGIEMFGTILKNNSVYWHINSKIFKTMKRTMIIILLSLVIVSCEKEESKFLIEYRFINKTSFDKLIVGIDSYTIFPNENVTIWKGKVFKLTRPDTVSIILNDQNDIQGYKGCKKFFSVNVEIYKNLGFDSVLYRSIAYERDTITDLAWQTINNSQDRISTFVWPLDTSIWIKTSDYILKYKSK